MSGFSELAVILIILVIVFGASTLPNLGTALGRLLARHGKGRADSERSGERLAAGQGEPDEDTDEPVGS